MFAAHAVAVAAGQRLALYCKSHPSVMVLQSEPPLPPAFAALCQSFRQSAAAPCLPPELAGRAPSMCAAKSMSGALQQACRATAAFVNYKRGRPPQRAGGGPGNASARNLPSASAPETERAKSKSKFERMLLLSAQRLRQRQRERQRQAAGQTGSASEQKPVDPHAARKRIEGAFRASIAQLEADIGAPDCQRAGLHLLRRIVGSIGVNLRAP